MLTHIKISNFAIVEELDLEIPQKLSVITGETGAGKSIMIDALGLALGDRADSGTVRSGCDRAEVLASFDTHTTPEARQWLTDRELDTGDDCILRRVINRDGRSRAYINGTPCPLQSIRELGGMLVNIYGQHEHQTLLKKDTHRTLLDEYGDLTPLAREVGKHYQAWKNAWTQYVKFRDNAKELSDRSDLLRFHLKELEVTGLEAGELSRLEHDHKRLSNTESLLQGSQQALAGLADGEQSLTEKTSSILSILNQMVRQDTSLQETCDMLESARIQLEEAGASLSNYMSSLEINPQHYQELDQRLAALHQLARKHGIPTNELIALKQDIQKELAQIDGGDNRVSQLEADTQKLKNTYLETAKKLSRGRKRQAENLAREITGQLRTLGMPAAVFDIQLEPLEENKCTIYGLESIEFIVAANPGQPPRPLNKVASGGELSRISLAIQVACSQKTSIGTFVFDEVDVGIGGAIAQVVGGLLRQLGERGQVLCVTHQPQVASQGHHHLFANKKTTRKATHTAIKALPPAQKQAEIARMLGGLTITEQTMAHAREMIETTQKA